MNQPKMTNYIYQNEIWISNLYGFFCLPCLEKSRFEWIFLNVGLPKWCLLSLILKSKDPACYFTGQAMINAVLLLICLVFETPLLRKNIDRRSPLLGLDLNFGPFL